MEKICVITTCKVVVWIVILAFVNFVEKFAAMGACAMSDETANGCRGAQEGTPVEKDVCRDLFAEDRGLAMEEAIHPWGRCRAGRNAHGAGW